MPLTDNELVETIEEGGGCVTEGDIHLLFEDVEREFAAMMSHNARGHFLASKLLQRLQNLLEVYGSNYDASTLPGKSGTLPAMGESNGRGGTSGRAQRQGVAVASRSPKGQGSPPPQEAEKEKEK